MSFHRFPPSTRRKQLLGRFDSTAVNLLILINVVVFVLQTISFLIYRQRDPLTTYFSLIPELITTKFYIWQFLTAMFMHDPINPLHIVFNMLGIYFFGRELEFLWGRQRFIVFYLASGMLAFLVTYLVNIHAGYPTLGASGAVLALLGAFATLFPDRQIILYVFPIKVKWFALGYGVLSLYGALGLSGGGGVAHLTHLAGLIIGFGYIQFRSQLRSPGWSNFWIPISERWRLWKLRRKYKNFKVLDNEVKELWDDLEDKINRDNSRIN
jgi:membrane associated rhomboid family serine protease